jgi:hypothetical protein
MMNLLKIGISENTINEMININSYPIVEDLDFNYENVLKIITYLKNNNINNKIISDLLVYGIDLFFKDFMTIEDKLSKEKLNSLVNNTNIDYSDLLELLFS